jgi:hypothetical protein
MLYALSSSYFLKKNEIKPFKTIGSYKFPPWRQWQHWAKCVGGQSEMLLTTHWGTCWKLIARILLTHGKTFD